MLVAAAVALVLDTALRRMGSRKRQSQVRKAPELPEASRDDARRA
jgi:hypothetical protein